MLWVVTAMLMVMLMSARCINFFSRAIQSNKNKSELAPATDAWTSGDFAMRSVISADS